MDSTYNSSFESEDDEEVQNKGETVTVFRESSTISKSVGKNELEFLCKGVSDLPLVTDPDTQARTNTSWIYKTASKYIEQSRLQIEMQKQPQKTQHGQKRNILKPVLYLTKSVSTFKGSASINRRKKLQQIEHDNLILLKKLQNVKPSSDVTEWKKQKRPSSALPNQMTRNTSRVERSAT